MNCELSGFLIELHQTPVIGRNRNWNWNWNWNPNQKRQCRLWDILFWNIPWCRILSYTISYRFMVLNNTAPPNCYHGFVVMNIAEMSPPIPAQW